MFKQNSDCDCGRPSILTWLIGHDILCNYHTAFLTRSKERRKAFIRERGWSEEEYRQRAKEHLARRRLE